MKWLAGPLPNSGSKGGRLHTVSCPVNEREKRKQPGRAKAHIGSPVLEAQQLTRAPPLVLITCTPGPGGRSYLCICLCIIPTFCGSECLYPETCLSLLFSLPASLCSLPHFLDGCKAMMLVLSCHPVVHMPLLPYFPHSALLSSPHPVNGPAPSVHSDTLHTLLPELKRWITCYFSQDYLHL